MSKKVIPISQSLRDKQRLHQNQFDDTMAQIEAITKSPDFQREQAEWQLRCALRQVEEKIGITETLKIIVDELIYLRSSKHG